MIYVFTPAEKNGGILQFSVTFTSELQKIHDCKLFVPDTVAPELLKTISENYNTYHKIKTFNTYNRNIKSFCKKIADGSPEHVIFLEDSVLMQQMCFWLSKEHIPVSMVVHDTVHHPSNSMTFRQKAVDFMRRRMTLGTTKTADNIILLSENSKNEFHTQNKNCKAALRVMRLGAHVPPASPVKPAELADSNYKYALFFGRIDKYKGIGDLCRAYSSIKPEHQNHMKLIIGGGGAFSEEEQQLIRENDNIIAINRFIEDGEMLWLIEHSEVVALPYIEATQSGVLPIAYHFGKPAIIRNLPGLTENAVLGKTAAAFDTADELSALLSETASGKLLFSTQEIKDFYEKNMNWHNNVKELMEKIL